MNGSGYDNMIELNYLHNKHMSCKGGGAWGTVPGISTLPLSLVQPCPQCAHAIEHLEHNL